VSAPATIGGAIAVARRARGLRQADAAALLGMSSSYLSKLEVGGHVPTRATLARIIAALDLDPALAAVASDHRRATLRKRVAEAAERPAPTRPGAPTVKGDMSPMHRIREQARPPIVASLPGREGDAPAVYIRRYACDYCGRTVDLSRDDALPAGWRTLTARAFAVHYVAGYACGCDRTAEAVAS